MSKQKNRFAEQIFFFYTEPKEEARDNMSNDRL